MGCAGNVTRVAKEPLREGPGKIGIQCLAIRKGNEGLAAKSMSCLPFISQYITADRNTSLSEYCSSHTRTAGSVTLDLAIDKHLRLPSKTPYCKITTGV